MTPDSHRHSTLSEVGEALDHIAAALPYMSDALGYVGFVRTHIEEWAEEVEELGAALARNVAERRKLEEQHERYENVLSRIASGERWAWLTAKEALGA